jgi:hypothetical protein
MVDRLSSTSWITTCGASSCAAVSCQHACFFNVRYHLACFSRVTADLRTLELQTIPTLNIFASLFNAPFLTKTAADTSFLGSDRPASDVCLLDDLPGEGSTDPLSNATLNAVCKAESTRSWQYVSRRSFDERSSTPTFQLRVAVHAYYGCKLILASGTMLELGSCSIRLRLTGSWDTLFGMPGDKAEATTSERNQLTPDNSTVLL